VHGAQDSSSFILLHEHSKVFKIIYTNSPGGGKRLSGESDCPGNVRYPFLPMSIAAKRLPISATAEHFFDGHVLTAMFSMAIMD